MKRMVSIDGYSSLSANSLYKILKNKIKALHHARIHRDKIREKNLQIEIQRIEELINRHN
jgi:hypothetical protein